MKSEIHLSNFNLIKKILIGITICLMMVTSVLASFPYTVKADVIKNKTFYIWSDYPVLITFYGNNDDTGKTVYNDWNGHGIGTISLSSYGTYNGKKGYKVTMTDVNVSDYTPYCEIMAKSNNGYIPTSISIIGDDGQTGANKTANAVHNLQDISNEPNRRFFYIGYEFTATELQVNYTPVNYTINYNTNGGSGSFPSQTKIHDRTDFRLHSASPSKVGYKFSGWKDSDGSTHSAGANYSKNKNDTLTAQWSPITYTVSFNKNKPSTASNNVTGSMDAITCTYDQAKTLTGNGYSLTGWSFNGWNTQANGSGVSYPNYASVRNLSSTQGTNITLYAQWKPNVYTLIFDEQYATTSGTSYVFEKYDTGWYRNKEATSSISTINTPKKTGMSFNGYYTEKDGQGTQYVDKDGKILVSNHSFTTDKRVYAYWVPAVYKITLDGQGATTPGTKAIYEKYNVGFYTTASCSIEISKITLPTKKNYVFDGYWTQQNSYTTSHGECIIDADGTVKDVNTHFKSDSTLYAKWVPLDFKINLNNQGADIDKGSPVFYEKYGEYNYTSSGDYDVNTGIATVRFDYTGNVQYFIAPADGEYTLNVAGAQGGSTYGTGGLGGTSTGKVTLKKGDKLNIYVGNQPNGSSSGFNGGGYGWYSDAVGGGNSSGGGATDIRKDGNSLDNRIIVAGGGGGGALYIGKALQGGTGGGEQAGNTQYHKYYNGSYVGWTNTKGANQTSSYLYSTPEIYRSNNKDNSRGYDELHIGNANSGSHAGFQYIRYSNGSDGQLSGGGGYYGGAYICGCDVIAAGLGGSGYIGGVTNGSMKSGTNSGNGWATISYNARAILQYSVVEKYFNYTGEVQYFTAPVDGEYLLEVAGAQGGSTYGTGGLGGTSTGKISLKKGEVLQIYVGNQPVGINAGYNGGSGGSLYSENNYKHIQISGGGGATDIRKDGNDLRNRIIVAGGGGGGAYGDDECSTSVPTISLTGGSGGGVESGETQCGDLSVFSSDAAIYTTKSKGATQSSSLKYKAEENASRNTNYGLYLKRRFSNYYNIASVVNERGGIIVGFFKGSLGLGATMPESDSICGGAGGGYYGGALVVPDPDFHSNFAAGFGGSGYIGGVTDGSMTTGTNKGNGWAKITYMDTSMDSSSVCSIRVPQKTGYTFDGYWTGVGGTGIQVINSNGDAWDNTTYFDVDKIPSKETTIYAKWTTGTYSVVYNGNGGKTPTGSISTYDNVSFNSNYTIKPKETFTRTGYTFNGWNEKADGTGKAWTAGATIKYDIPHGTTLYAQWVPNNVNYKINYYQQNLDGKTYTNINTVTKSGKADSEVTVSPNTYYGFTLDNTKTVVTYNYSNGNLKTQINSNGSVVTTIAYDGSTVINFYYTRNSYTVTLNKDTGINSVSGAGNYLYGATVEISTSSNSGYTFNTWTKNNPTTLSLDKNTSINENSFTMPASNVTLTANSKKLADATYNVTLIPNGTVITFNGRQYTTQTTIPSVTVSSQHTVTCSKPGYNCGLEVSSVTKDSKISGTTFTMGTSDTTIIASKSAAETSYKVYHWVQKIGGNANSYDSNNYALYDGLAQNPITSSALTDSYVEPPLLSGDNILGLTAMSGTKKVQVKADGSTRIDYYYRRNVATFNYNTNSGVLSSTPYAYGGKYYKLAGNVLQQSTSAGGTYSNTQTKALYKDNAFKILNLADLKVSKTGYSLSETNTYLISGSDPAAYLSAKNYYKDINYISKQLETGDKTFNLVAQWNPMTYTITLNKANGSGGSDKFYEIYENNKFNNPIAKNNEFYLTDVCDTPVTGISKPSILGYTFNGYYTGTNGTGTKVVDANGNIVVTNSFFKADTTIYAYWTANNYTISYNLNDVSASVNPSYGTNHPTSASYNTAFTVNNPSMTGYNFNKWSVSGMTTDCTHYYGQNTSSFKTTKDTTLTPDIADIVFKNLRSTSGTVTFKANWVARTDTKYYVNHYLMNIDGNGYTFKETTEKKGTSDSTITLSDLKKTYTGFTYNSGNATTKTAQSTPPTGIAAPTSTVETTTILADGTRVINLFYTRNKYTVTLTNGTGIASTSGAGTYYYDASVTIDATVKTGYTWSKWTGTYKTATKKYAFNMPASNVSMTANATPNKYNVYLYPNRPTNPKSLSDVTISKSGNTSTAYKGWKWDATNKRYYREFTYDSTTIDVTPNEMFALTGYTIDTTNFYTSFNANGTGKGTKYTSANMNLASAQGATVNLYPGWTDNVPTISNTYKKNVCNTTQTFNITVGDTGSGIKSYTMNGCGVNKSYTYSSGTVSSSKTETVTVNKEGTLTITVTDFNGKTTTSTITFYKTLLDVNNGYIYGKTAGTNLSYTSKGNTCHGYSLNTEKEVITSTGTRDGNTFMGWNTSASSTTGSKSITVAANNATRYYAIWKDEVKPVAVIDKVTNNTSRTQTITFSLYDSSKGGNKTGSDIAGYYFGTNATYNGNGNTYKAVTCDTTYGYKKFLTETVTPTAKTTYYIFAVDKAGNVSATATYNGTNGITFYQITLCPNGSEISKASITVDGVTATHPTGTTYLMVAEANTVTLPTASRVGYHDIVTDTDAKSNHYATTSTGTDYCTTWKAVSDKMLYVRWEANTYTVKLYPNKPNIALRDYVLKNPSGWTWNNTEKYYSKIFTYDAIELMPEISNTFTIESWQPSGWFKEPTGKTLVGTGTKRWNLVSVNHGSISLYPQWADIGNPDINDNKSKDEDGREPTLNDGSYTWDWTNKAITINVIATDIGSGIKQIDFYETNSSYSSSVRTNVKSDAGNGIETKTSSYTVPEGERYYVVVATDRYGNTSELKYHTRYDKVAIKLSPVTVNQQTLAGSSSASIENDIKNGLNTTFTLTMNDTNANTSVDKNVSGLKMAILEVWDKDNINDKLTYNLLPSNVVRTNNASNNILSCTLSINPNLYADFKDSEFLTWKITVIDYAGNESYVNATNIITNYSSKTFIYNETVDSNGNEIYNDSDENTYFQVGEIGRVEVYTVGYTSNVSLDFKELGKESAIEINDGRMNEVYRLGTNTDKDMRILYSSDANEIIPTYLRLHDDSNNITKYTNVTENMLRNLVENKYAQHYKFTIQIPPYYKLKENGKLRDDGSPLYDSEIHTYEAIVNKGSSSIKPSNKLTLWDNISVSVHYRVTHES